MTSSVQKRNPAIRGDVETRFAKKHTVMPDGCWLWVDGGLNCGYGQLFTGATTVLAHRWAYEKFRGPIPDGLVVDHLCHNRDETCAGGASCRHRRCVNPDHLDLTDTASNVRRSRHTPGNQTHCKWGHPYDEENTIQRGNRRKCRTCTLEFRRKFSEARSEKRRLAREARQAR